jgi:hypothetical protein
MEMEMIKKYKALLVIALIMAAGIFFFFYHFGHNDAKAIGDFSVAYEKFDKAISDFSSPVIASNLESAPATDDLERKADEALVELNTKASARISSLTKNDAELMNVTLEIADLSKKELDTLKAYKSALADKNVDLNKLAKEFGDLTNKRQTAYALFRELAGLKD